MNSKPGNQTASHTGEISTKEEEKKWAPLPRGHQLRALQSSSDVWIGVAGSEAPFSGSPTPVPLEDCFLLWD